MSSDTFSKWLGIAVILGGPLIGAWVKLNALEDAKAGHADVLTEQRMEIRKLSEKVDALERERWNASTQTLERINGIEKQLVEIKALLRQDDRERGRRR